MGPKILSIPDAVKILKNGDVVAMPTETVYGLAGSTESNEGLNAIFAKKNRPFFDPLIVHVANIDNAKLLAAHWNKYHEVLAKNFWPGPMTMIVPKASHVSPLITSGLESVGIRIPKHEKALELLTHFPQGLAAPSANKFGKTSPTKVEHVYAEFSDQVGILDGGECEVGIESTILEVIDEKEIRIYRPGVITKQMIEKVIQDAGLKVLEVKYEQSPVAPGQLKHHYMPKIPLIISVSENPKTDLKNPFIWKLPSDPLLAARRLYQDMREVPPQHDGIILIKTFNETQDEWRGIWNRLEKAASAILK